MLRYFDAVWGLGVDLHGPIARDLGLPEDHFRQFFDAPLATLRLLRYPPGTGAGGRDRGGRAYRLRLAHASPHRRGAGARGAAARGRLDPCAACAGGLRRQHRRLPDALDERHLRLDPAPRASARHRRRSVAFFLDPNPDAVIAALPGHGRPKYPPVTGADYLRSRLDATYRPDTAA
jgi:hypothetical protein